MFLVLSVFSLLFCTFWIIGCRWRFRGTRSNGCYLIDSVVYSNLSEAIALLRDYRFGIEDKESWKSYSNATQPCWKSGQISRICDIRGIGTVISRHAMNMRYSGRSICLHIIALCIAWDVRAAVWKELVGLAVPAFKNTAEDGLLHAIFFESKC